MTDRSGFWSILRINEESPTCITHQSSEKQRPLTTPSTLSPWSLHGHTRSCIGCHCVCGNNLTPTLTSLACTTGRVGQLLHLEFQLLASSACRLQPDLSLSLQLSFVLVSSLLLKHLLLLQQIGLLFFEPTPGSKLCLLLLQPVFDASLFQLLRFIVHGFLISSRSSLLSSLPWATCCPFGFLGAAVSLHQKEIAWPAGILSANAAVEAHSISSAVWTGLLASSCGLQSSAAALRLIAGFEAGN